MKPPIIEDDSSILDGRASAPAEDDLQLPTDRRTLALWLACCTGKPNVLRAIFHEPKVGLMISTPY